MWRLGSNFVFFAQLVPELPALLGVVTCACKRWGNWFGIFRMRSFLSGCRQGNFYRAKFGQTRVEQTTVEALGMATTLVSDQLNSHPTERISQFVDYHLKPLVQTT